MAIGLGRRVSAGALVWALTLAPAVAQTQAGASDSEDAAAPDIVVTASGYEQRIIEAPASISVLDRANLEEKRFGSLAEALQDVQGIDVGGEAGNVVNVADRQWVGTP